MIFIDIEVSKKKNISDFGAISDKENEFHDSDIFKFIEFIKRNDFFVGHNIVKHDYQYLKETKAAKFFNEKYLIDTLFLSTLLFPDKPYHKLIKDDKLFSDQINNPLNDSKNSKIVFYDSLNKFNSLSENIKEIFYSLLSDIVGFSGFFRYIKYSSKVKNLEDLIKYEFKNEICEKVDLKKMIKEYPVELAYCLSIISTEDKTSLLPPWILKTYPMVETIMMRLRNTQCDDSCKYCNDKLNLKKSLKKYFGYENFREFDGQPLQENAVKSAVKQESMITVFPTGGGKSLTFQLPALIASENARALTVVISPLQSLMKDQVDNLESKNISSSVTVNGLLNPIERTNAIKRVEDGSASILYIAPESLRSKTMERVISGRHVVRFVIDEAHCFSTWGHDFRVDYLYIAEFIKNIQDIKNNKTQIPVSCFTATAKPNVIEDIYNYFKLNLNIDMKIFKTSSQRTNLQYKVYEVKEEEDKYKQTRQLIDMESASTIVYASRRSTVNKLYDRLKKDGYSVAKFHGGMENEEKIFEQNLFMSGEAQIMISTNAFGMGVDKQDIKCVIHFEISDSLENYIQEAGRAGRDQSLNANCYILYDEDDLNKHFEMLNRSKLQLKEIQQIWKAIKELTKLRDKVSQSALEIARIAGWDDSISDLSTRVSTAISALETVGYIKRGQNSPRVFADSLLVKSVIEANKIIESSSIFEENEIVSAKRIISNLVSNKSKSIIENSSETTIDQIADSLYLSREEVIKIISKFRELDILADHKDLYAQLAPNSKSNSMIHELNTTYEIIKYILENVTNESKIINLKSLNEEIEKQGIKSNMVRLGKAINYLSIAKMIESKKEGRDLLSIKLYDNKETISNQLQNLIQLSEYIIEYLCRQSSTEIAIKDKNLVPFSVIEIRNKFNSSKSLLDSERIPKDVEDAILFLAKVNILKIEGGFLISYNPYNIDRLVKENSKQYTKSDYKKLEDYYQMKKEQIHIVGEYASKMVNDYNRALSFVNDYFVMDYTEFINKHFKSERKKEISYNMTPRQFKKLFGSLSPEQLKVILDKEHQKIAVAAGPGSGKTKLLVHKLASILMTEDIRQEHLLMLTFSRSAVLEFRERLQNLIGDSSKYVNITTFHSFAFDLLGRVGNLDNTANIIAEATNLIKEGLVEPLKVTKSVLVIDEAQDMNKDELDFIQELINYNDNLRVIAVGDDDQNIFEFRGSSSEYFKEIAQAEDSFYELSINYRSKKNIVEFSNYLVRKIPNRLKTKSISSYTNDLGKINIHRYKQASFITSLVKNIAESNLPGTTGILTRTNEQAMIITGLLNKQGLRANLIQENRGFSLYSLLEFRTFYNYLSENNTILISNESWIQALEYLEKEFSQSENYQNVFMILNKFKRIYKDQIYLTDLLEFLKQSNLSDYTEIDKVMVSTFHKAKGKEFDNVFILFDNEYELKPSVLRTLYVALTRTKSNLSIHTTSKIFNNIKIDNLDYFDYDIFDDELKYLSFIFEYTGVKLSYFDYVQHRVKKLKSGDKLYINESNDVLNDKNEKILSFSNKFNENYIQYNLSKGYKITNLSVKYINYWYEEKNKKEVLIVLPQIEFEKVEESID